jgi:putative phosphoribosyl transferase
VTALLDRAWDAPAGPEHPATEAEGPVLELPVPERNVRMRAGPVTLEGDLAMSPQARGIVLFVHGSGSSRRSPRDRVVAEMLQQAGLGTLLVDLLTSREAALDEFNAALRFDIGRLAQRLMGVTDWVRRSPSLSHLRIGYFGAGTDAAAALVAAAERPGVVGAIVSLGGRPDLAGNYLERVEAPTLLIVGGVDTPVLDLNREALTRLYVPKRLDVIPGATHLFEEPGALCEVARAAADWFVHHLAARSMAACA